MCSLEENQLRNGLVFYIVDVFAEKLHTGNQLAVVIDPIGLDGVTMLSIAKEFGFSETTFVLQNGDSGDGFDVRIFTPDQELPFAGHPTLGTAFVIQKEILRRELHTVTLDLKIGTVPVDIESTGEGKELFWMTHPEPKFGERHSPEKIAPILGLTHDDIDNNFPCCEVSTGFPYFIVPLKDLNSLRKSKVDGDKYYSYIENTLSKAILVFSPETYDESNDLCVRVFGDFYGIPEDPATGSAAGCLGAYLLKYRYFDGSSLDIKVEQGCQLNRPSLISIRAFEAQGVYDIKVGGRVFLVAKGELFI